MHYTFEEPDEPVDILEQIIMSLVEHPHEVEIDITEGESTAIYSIDVVPEDRGKIIGRGGCIIKSLQTVFHAIGCKRGTRIDLEIKE